MAQSTHFLSGRRIVIAGAGLAGLSFAIALRKTWPEHLPPPEITIFERDTQQDAEGRQGYTLSLSGFEETGGLVALRDLGLLDDILARAIVGLDGKGGFKIWGADWTEWMSVRLRPLPGIAASTVRVARKDLRHALLNRVSDEVRWGTMCTSATKQTNGRIRIHVRSGASEDSIEECDLLIVADGANSKIRASLRPDDDLDYAGAIQLVGVGNFPERVPPPVDENWGLQLSGQGVCCFYAPTDEHNVLWSVSFLEPGARPKQTFTSHEDIQPLLQEARERSQVFGPRLRSIIDATTDPGSISCLSARDKKPFRHDRDTGIIYIGDSNHAVSPFAGYGANLALKDGWDLAQSLVASSSTSDAVRRYDGLSVPRAVKTLNSSRWRIKYGHSTGLRFWLFRIMITFGGFVFRVLGKS